MAEYKSNHHIPKSLLKQWETTEGGLKGVFVYNSKKEKIDFSRTNDNYSFAAKNYLYVPEKAGKRLPDIELYFGKIDGILSKALYRLNKHVEEAIFPTGNFIDKSEKFLKALLSLKYRTLYNISNMKKLLFEKPELKTRIEMNKPTEIDLLTLENMMNGIDEEFNEFRNFESFVFENNSGSLIIGDQPFLALDTMNFIPLSPKYLFVFRKSSSNSTFRYLNMNNQIVDAVNKYIALNSRYWIVSNDKRNLEKYIIAFKETKPNYEPVLKEIRHLTSGYKL